MPTIQMPIIFAPSKTTDINSDGSVVKENATRIRQKAIHSRLPIRRRVLERKKQNKRKVNPARPAQERRIGSDSV